MRGDTLYIGIDLGTFRSSICTSRGEKKTLLSLVGWPKDAIAQRLLNQQPIVFGEEALENRLLLSLCRPLEKGVIKHTLEDESNASAEEKGLARQAAKELVRHLVHLADPRPGEKVYGVIGAPARANLFNKEALIDASREVLDAVMVVSEPFTVAYGRDFLKYGLVIDIGAGTTDLCRMHGTIPEEEDQRTVLKAGDSIDELLFQLLQEKCKEAQLTRNMARLCKERHGFVSHSPHGVVAEFPVRGKLVPYDITEEMKRACESIVPEITEALRDLVGSFDPEFQPVLRHNVVLAGGCSQIRQLDRLMEENMADMGGGKVTVVDDPIYAGAQGALRLAMDMPLDYWRQL
ncbi:MAG: rod shape-determining protein [Candidatus Tectomicrobia bacterium]|uniref:Rod shape-determining protein n=1 Tax=Tectimicrobiota bacterium TaxID=2528274 RepID=A0A932G0T0_UNCTE|nr:rod shape-determining protein [Candidatus Tectomicrobia bacterium]